MYKWKIFVHNSLKLKYEKFQNSSNFLMHRIISFEYIGLKR